MRSLVVVFVAGALACGPSPELASAPVQPVPIQGQGRSEPLPPVVLESPRAEPLECPSVAAPPARREENGLIVETPAKFPAQVGSSRLRSHVHGPLSARNRRLWAGPEVPVFVPIASGTKELFLLDRVGEHHVALYRDPYEASSCTLGGSATNCAFEIRVFRCDETVAVLPLARFFSRPDHLEVQDVRYQDGVVYFNEACQSYSRDARGRCSSLVAIEVASQRVLWRTPPLFSNNMFAVAGDYIVAAYGFTAEPSRILLLRRSDGKLVAEQPLPGSHDALFVEPNGLVRVGMYSMEPDQWFRIRGRSLQPASAPPDAPSWRKPRVHTPVGPVMPPLPPKRARR